MYILRSNLAVLFINWYLLIARSVAEDILGCGGFVKSHTNIDFSKVHIKLYTKAGSLKDQTECAPNSGYYFLPLYDKGEYVLKVDPPRGWSFEPAEASLVVDGLTDECSRGNDINFIFKGYGITGKVISSGSDYGPEGVLVSLYTETNKTFPIGTTTTAAGGIFYFTPIQPGKYVLVASHPVWIMEKSTVEVIVKEGNTELTDNNLVVSGYDVSGRVTSENEPVGGVVFILFGTGKAKNCATTPIKGFETRSPLCHVVSDKAGKFTFPSLSPGEYKLIPHYAGARTKFEVQPSELKFKVIHESLILPQDFQVTGFMVSGIVRTSPQGNVLPGAEVFLAGKQVAITDKDGKYTVDNMKAGQYTLKAEADNVQFQETTVKVSPSSSEFPTLTPHSYKVCGKVTLSAKNILHHRKVAVQRIASTFYEEINTNSKTGEFCLYITSGKYQLNVIVSVEEKTKGLQFFPLQHTIDVSSEPINNINFLQLKATLKGKIQCLKDSNCSHSSVTLKILDGVTLKTIQADDGEYQFSEILPGHYEVLIDTDVFCWDNPSHRISVTSEHAEIPSFQQTGFSVTFISSHDTVVEFSEPKDSKRITLSLPRGSTRHCVSKSGEYEFAPKGCHAYVKPSFVWDTSSQLPVILSSTEHRHKGRIISVAALDEVKVKIESIGESIVLGPLKYAKKEDAYEYEYEFNAYANNEYTITPLSNILLFNPPSMKVLGVNDCVDNIATFIGDLGKIVSGRISPTLGGVTIKIFGKDKNSPIQTLVTQADGVYKIGPLDGKIDYSVIAEKEGFVITGPDASGIFSAHKLAEIIVDVLDQADNASLQGVLLSLSGGQSYRKNSMTGEIGQLIFNSLSPGEYFLRPMMKEYRFDPPSKIINVVEGATVRVKLTGNRVAFSAYGSVTSLNGEPEAGLLVEALGEAECSSRQEETTTEESGNFRIRGLQPSCIYTIRLKPNAEANARILRATPSSISVEITEDVHDVRLIALYLIPRTDVTVHVVAEQPEHYRTLTVEVFNEDTSETSITLKLDSSHTVKAGSYYNPGVVRSLSPLRMNGMKYFARLHSSLSSTLYNCKTTPVYFEANSSFKPLRLTFSAERRADQGDISQTSIVALPLIMILALVFFNRDKVWNWSNLLVENWSRAVPISRAPVQAIPIDPRADDIIVEQIMNINKRKTKPRKA